MNDTGGYSLKKMEKKLIDNYAKIVLSFFLICVGCYVAGAPTPSGIKNYDIKDLIINGSCATFSHFRDSKYLSKCRNAKIPTKNGQVPKEVDEEPQEYRNQYLCIMFYDITHKICQYNSKVEPGEEYKNILVPENATVLDNSLDNLQKEIGGDEESFCNKEIPEILSSLNLVEESDDSYINYVNFVKIKMLNKENCKFSCHKSEKDLNELCLLMLWASEAIRSTKSKISHHSIDVVDKKRVPDINKKQTNNLSKDSQNKDKENEELVVSPIRESGTLVVNSEQKKNNSKPNNSQAVEQTVKTDYAKNGVKEPSDADTMGFSPSSEENLNNLPDKNIDNNLREDHIVDPDQDIDIVPELKDKNIVRKDLVTSEQTEDGTHFLTIFTLLSLIIILYFGFHFKQKLFAIVIEGRRSQRGRHRRPSTANYRKLDTTLEEAVNSSCNTSVSHIIY